MKHLLLTATLLFAILCVNGQSNVIDTVYLNSKWEKTIKANATYFRTISKDKDGLYDCHDYWITGELQMTGKLSCLYPETRDGDYVWYYKNGEVQRRIKFFNNKIVGSVKLYRPDGQFDIEYITYIDSLDNCKKVRSAIDNFRYFVSNSLVYPKQSQNAGIEGTVITHFYLNQDGEVERLEVIQSVDSLLDNEAMRVVQSFKKWSRPIYQGKKIYLELTFPVIFALQ